MRARLPSNPTSMKPMQAPPIRRERGVVMVIALITLAIMMIGAVAALRSMNASLTNAGNFGFKRDMGNQAERGLRQAMNGLNTTTLDLTANQSSLNYSASMLTATPEGIPTVLLGNSPSTAGGVGVATNVIDLTTAAAGSTTAPQNVIIYYVTDRMCQAAGSMDPTTCLTASNLDLSDDKYGGITKPTSPLYRVTVRIDGPRGAQSYYQATFSK